MPIKDESTEFDRFEEQLDKLMNLDGDTRSTAAPTGPLTEQIRPPLAKRLERDDEGAMHRKRLEDAHAGESFDEGETSEDQLDEIDDQVVERMLDDIIGSILK